MFRDFLGSSERTTRFRSCSRSCLGGDDGHYDTVAACAATPEASRQSAHGPRQRSTSGHDQIIACLSFAAGSEKSRCRAASGAPEGVAHGGLTLSHARVSHASPSRGRLGALHSPVLDRAQRTCIGRRALCRRRRQLCAGIHPAIWASMVLVEDRSRRTCRCSGRWCALRKRPPVR